MDNNIEIRKNEKKNVKHNNRNNSNFIDFNWN